MTQAQIKEVLDMHGATLTVTRPQVPGGCYCATVFETGTTDAIAEAWHDDLEGAVKEVIEDLA